MAFEIDLLRMYEFHHSLKTSSHVNMTSTKKVGALEKAVKKLVTNTMVKISSEPDAERNSEPEAEGSPGNLEGSSKSGPKAKGRSGKEHPRVQCGTKGETKIYFARVRVRNFLFVHIRLSQKLKDISVGGTSLKNRRVQIEVPRGCTYLNFLK
jgi:hypothetical protein